MLAPLTIEMLRDVGGGVVRDYSVGTYDYELRRYTPQIGVPAFNLTLWELKQSLRMLRESGYSAHRIRSSEGNHNCNDPDVLVERTDGELSSEILERWRR